MLNFIILNCWIFSLVVFHFFHSRFFSFYIQGKNNPTPFFCTSRPFEKNSHTVFFFAPPHRFFASLHRLNFQKSHHPHHFTFSPTPFYIFSHLIFQFSSYLFFIWIFPFVDFQILHLWIFNFFICGFSISSFMEFHKWKISNTTNEEFQNP